MEGCFESFISLNMFYVIMVESKLSKRLGLFLARLSYQV